ncbi:hypothetical protein XOC_3978 [Xanthomonas oryzae pv. oryzicola BLS256]|uniref:Uncharacterized protein n=1 Tax=Xanthomonas oryzae pv. oryzicola (strain BLS256) TaxID=383407 RepID=G7THT1_XANOB|nr:hypothetical protein XOC_3978 [Xanthomonas oryzae pv. oryzicola BLS256]QEO95747.1 hypothetical protein XOCgx_0753 [Xanthomonas oryzae pv. oryzicola]
MRSVLWIAPLDRIERSRPLWSSPLMRTDRADHPCEKTRSRVVAPSFAAASAAAPVA